MEETFKKPLLHNLPIFVSDSITTNIYSLIDIYKNNIKKGNDFIKSKHYQKLPWIEKILLSEKLIEQQSLLDYSIEKLKDLEDLTFRFGS